MTVPITLFTCLRLHLETTCATESHECLFLAVVFFAFCQQINFTKKGRISPCVTEFCFRAQPQLIAPRHTCSTIGLKLTVPKHLLPGALEITYSPSLYNSVSRSVKHAATGLELFSCEINAHSVTYKANAELFFLFLSFFMASEGLMGLRSIVAYVYTG